MKPNSYCRQAVCRTTVLSLWPGVVLAQGTSPWLDEVLAIEAFFNGPVAGGSQATQMSRLMIDSGVRTSRPVSVTSTTSSSPYLLLTSQRGYPPRW